MSIIKGDLLEKGILGFESQDRYSMHYYSNDLVNPHGRGTWETFPFIMIINFKQLSKSIFGLQIDDTISPMGQSIIDKEVYFIIPNTNPELEAELSERYGTNINFDNIRSQLQTILGSSCTIYRYNYCNTKITPSQAIMTPNLSNDDTNISNFIEEKKKLKIVRNFLYQDF